MNQSKLNKAQYEKRLAIKRGDKYKFISIMAVFCVAGQSAIIAKSFTPVLLYIGVLSAIKFKRLYDEKTK